MKKFLAFACMIGGTGTLAGCNGVTDSIVWLPNSRPAPVASFQYANDDASDVQLFSSLRDMADVTATFDSAALPSQLANWRDRIARTGNEVWQCDTAESSGYIPIAFPSLASWAGRMIYAEARARVMYSAADDFDAILLFDSDNNRWEGMRFVHTGADLASARAGYAKCEQV